MRPARLALALFLFVCRPTLAQQASESSTPEPVRSTLPSGIDRVAGTDPSSQIQYVRLILKGSLHSAAQGAPEASIAAPPVFIAQCTLRPNGKYLFEVFASFGGPADLAFYPPWKPASRNDLFPPRTEKTVLIMDFLGYTHVKPFRRQWEIPIQTPGVFHYNPPSAGSSNLEEFSYFLRYLLSLPTLRLTLDHQNDHRAAEFLTTPLLSEIRQEPLCRAAGL